MATKPTPLPKFAIDYRPKHISGFIRRFEKAHSSLYIPDDIKYMILLYYIVKEYFILHDYDEKKISNNSILNKEHTVIQCNKEINLPIMIYGTQNIDLMDDSIIKYRWTFKVWYLDYVGTEIGIRDINESKRGNEIKLTYQFDEFVMPCGYPPISGLEWDIMRIDVDKEKIKRKNKKYKTSDEYWINRMHLYRNDTFCQSKIIDGGKTYNMAIILSVFVQKVEMLHYESFTNPEYCFRLQRKSGNFLPNTVTKYINNARQIFNNIL